MVGEGSQTHLTSADLAGVISRVETVTWTIHSALKYTVYERKNKIISHPNTLKMCEMQLMFANLHTQGNTRRAH